MPDDRMGAEKYEGGRCRQDLKPQTGIKEVLGGTVSPLYATAALQEASNSRKKLREKA